MRRVRAGVALALGLLLAACSGGGGSGRTGAAPTDFYAEPPLPVRTLRLAEGEDGSPRELLLFVPDAPGDYPLLQFQHGFISDIDTYTQLLGRLAGFGFVVAAPQMYTGDPSSAPAVADETADAVAVLAWLQQNVDTLLAARMEGAAPRADIDATGLLGHSRGGQIAWRMLFDHPDTRARAIAGVDPVDGDAPPFPPGGTGEMVTDDPGAFAFPFASLILGMGLGATGVPGFECAPANRNYTFFYDASAPPRYEVVAQDYGHSDTLDGEEPSPLCVGAVDGTRGQLRIFVAGQLAAYFRATLAGEDTLGLLRDLSGAPITASGRFDD